MIIFAPRNRKCMSPGIACTFINDKSMEQLKHECGVAMIRLLKPLEYYEQKYGTWMYGLNKLYLLMEKQHNRGQEGAGLACVKLEANPGEEYMFRERALGSGAITEAREPSPRYSTPCTGISAT